jgi:hypothetical protein
VASKIGKMPIVVHRPVIGTIKTLTTSATERASGSRCSASNWMTKDQNAIEARRSAWIKG